MNFKDVRTGVVGVGSMGQNHARIYSEISNLVGIVDTDKAQGSKIAKLFGVRYFENIQELISHGVDAVTVSVPTNKHLNVAEIFANSNVNLLVEKPLAGSLDEAHKIVDICAKNKVILAVGHVERHNPVVRKCQEFMSQTSAEIITLSSRRCSNFPDRIKDVGVLYDLIIHDVDIIRFLVNRPIVSVFASGGKIKHPIYEDYANLIMKFEDNKTGLCEANWLTPMKIRELNITTTDYNINLDYLNQKMYVSSSKFIEVPKANLYSSKIDYTYEEIEIVSEEPLKNEIVDFLHSVKNQRDPYVNGLDGLAAVRIIEAANSSLNKENIKLK